MLPSTPLQQGTTVDKKTVTGQRTMGLASWVSVEVAEAAGGRIETDGYLAAPAMNAATM